jgi:hypothetical protein
MKKIDKKYNLNQRTVRLYFLRLEKKSQKIKILWNSLKSGYRHTPDAIFGNLDSYGMHEKVS